MNFFWNGPIVILTQNLVVHYNHLSSAYNIVMKNNTRTFPYILCNDTLVSIPLLIPKSTTRNNTKPLCLVHCPSTSIHRDTHTHMHIHRERNKRRNFVDHLHILTSSSPHLRRLICRPLNSVRPSVKSTRGHALCAYFRVVSPPRRIKTVALCVCLARLLLSRRRGIIVTA